MKLLTSVVVVASALSGVSACQTGETSDNSETSSGNGVAGGSAAGSTATGDDAENLKNTILTLRSTDCADYAGQYTAQVLDIQDDEMFTEQLSVSVDGERCAVTSNSIPNHDFNDESARFATPAAEVAQQLSIPRSPQLSASVTSLTQRYYDAVMLNGVVLDILSAGCYKPDDPKADAEGNVMIGCTDQEPWLLDPLSTEGSFGADKHNAHTQPDGLYHYHGNPNALFDDNPGPDGSPIIGFAADGFPIYGSYFKEPDTGEVRKALSGYTLKQGERPSTAGNPGGRYTGVYNDDYEFTGVGDLDECNGMSLDGSYGYYVTDSYPWVIRCFKGTPDASFAKRGGMMGPPM